LFGFFIFLEGKIKLRQYSTLKKIQGQTLVNNYIASIAVRVKNEEKGLPLFWESIVKQTCFQFLEITFLDSGSTDRTIPFLKSINCNIYTIESAEFNFGDSCNLMMSLTNTNYVFLFSGHVILEDNSLIETVNNFINGRHISGYFRQIPNMTFGCSVYDAAFLKFAFRTFKSSLPILIKRKNSFSNAASVISRSHWEMIYFKEVLFGEDEIWANEVLDSGGNIYYFHKFNVMHSHNDTSDDVRKRISKAAIVKFPHGINVLQLIFIFSKVFIAILISSGRLIESLRYAQAHMQAYADIKRNNNFF
jgi:glycosyltransferase involved in cell wall biosynthesis